MYVRTITGCEYVLFWAPEDLPYWWRNRGEGKLLLISRRADVRWAAVSSSTGIGLPSAVDGTSEVDEALLGPKKRGGKEKGRGLCLPSLGCLGGGGSEAREWE